MNPTPPAARLAADDLCLALDGRPLLRAAAISLRAGEVAVLEGPSGCGKSTFLRVLARLAAADRGRLSLDGVDARRIAPEAWRRRVAYVAQLPAMFDGTVADNLAAGPALVGASLAPAACAALLARVGLDPGLAARAARDLSGGERMRAAIARALANEPAALLLDEPTAALDDASAATVVALARSLAADGCAVAVVTHAREHAEALGGARYRFVDGAPRPEPA